MIRMNITLPQDIAQDLGRFSNKSHFIAEAVRERLKREKIKRLDNLLIEGYQATKEEDKKINQDWGKASLKNWS